ncbi:hypothetical protein CPB86DRAFT_781128, partial [Serendipita vermifera]
MMDLRDFPTSMAGQVPTTHGAQHRKASIDEIDNEAIDLEGRILDLRQEKATYACHVSAFRRVPTELLREIIKDSLKLGVKIGTLTQICSRFRDVMFGL